MTAVWQRKIAILALGATLLFGLALLLEAAGLYGSRSAQIGLLLLAAGLWAGYYVARTWEDPFRTRRTVVSIQRRMVSVKR